MNKRILYTQENGVLAVITPVDDNLTIEDIAKKDVPAGTPYLIVDESVIPTDRLFREAWEADFAIPDGYGLGHDAWLSQKETIEVSE